MDKTLSIIIPACNEAEGLRGLLPQLSEQYPDAEIIVVNDGSTDQTAAVCEEYGVLVLNHPYRMGNGAAIKSGARQARGEIFVFMDADGQHRPEDIPQLLSDIDEGYYMVVGARKRESHSSIWRYLANQVYNQLASWITGHKVIDLTSGFRAVRAGRFLEFLNILPNGFSAPTTITMSFFRVGYPVKYTPVAVKKDVGSSHIAPLKDGAKFLLIIFRIAALYSPLKVFVPVSLTFLVSGLSYYGYTYATEGRFTNMGILLLITAVLSFLIGLLSEQITFLIYSQNHNKQK